MIAQILFTTIFISAVLIFTWRIRKVIRNINLGRDEKLNDRKAERWKTMMRVALGQSKMTNRPVAAFFHILIYVGFVIVNIEVIEIIVDGIFGTHRFLNQIIPLPLYNFLIGSFEILAALVWIACVVFLLRRNVLKLKRFWMKEMTSWPRTDANLILITEITLMTAFLLMNGADHAMQMQGSEHYIKAGAFPVSGFLFGWFNNVNVASLELLERSCWWYHIIGILFFLNYLPFSKHLHILLAFPNTWYSRLQPAGYFNSNTTVTNEVKLMLDPTTTPVTNDTPPAKFGSKDVQDLSWKSLLDAYSCTECGRCSSSCPANITGKKLSPRKIMMDTRDRLEEVGKNIDQHGKDFSDGKSLLNDYITEEELWACTSCNACVEECPVNINPLSIITDLRRYLVMEESKAPNELAMMMSNIENNQAPWQFSPSDRFNWADGLNIPTMADMSATGETPDVLFWVGCAGAYEERAKKTTKAVAELLHMAGVKFAVLGKRETCTGDSARRTGNEFVYQILSKENIETFTEVFANFKGKKKVVVTCPHCFTTIGRDYKQQGYELEAVHHTQLLNQLVRDGKLKPVAKESKTITYHDPCYLGRHNQVYTPPRELLEASGLQVKEMPRNQERSFCCGAGGGRMWQEEKLGTQINLNRVDEAIATGADEVAVACPFCRVMVSDGVQGRQSEVEVLDVAQALLRSVKP